MAWETSCAKSNFSTMYCFIKIDFQMLNFFRLKKTNTKKIKLVQGEQMMRSRMNSRIYSDIIKLNYYLVVIPSWNKKRKYKCASMNTFLPWILQKTLLIKFRILGEMGQLGLIYNNKNSFIKGNKSLLHALTYFFIFNVCIHYNFGQHLHL